MDCRYAAKLAVQAVDIGVRVQFFGFVALPRKV